MGKLAFIVVAGLFGASAFAGQYYQGQKGIQAPAKGVQAPTKGVQAPVQSSKGAQYNKGAQYDKGAQYNKGTQSSKGAQYDKGYVGQQGSQRGYIGERRYHNDRRYYDDGVGFGAGVGLGAHCAPEVVQGNVVKTDRVLKSLAASSEFAQARDFRNAVATISNIRDTERKVSEYFAMLGIDASDNAQIAEFLGARRPSSQWLVSLERNVNLTPRQADRVVEELSSALRGGLR